LYRGFARFSRWYVRRHFHALRVANREALGQVGARPVLVYLNHPGWWDPLIGLMLADVLLPDHAHYAPIDAAALGEYAFFARLGFFGIDPGQAAGGRKFLRIGQAVMSGQHQALWVTAQGAMADPRQRPVQLRPGVAHLANHLAQGVVLPLAVEYPFWEEKKPEALAMFGEPMDLAALPKRSAAQWQTVLTDQLTQTMDALAKRAQQRDANAWDLLLSSQVGTTAIYDLWRAARARWRGQRFRRAHGEMTRND
jgi:1-acyl-sn-glycerol-3-phosphate acyltransferase